VLLHGGAFLYLEIEYKKHHIVVVLYVLPYQKKGRNKKALFKRHEDYINNFNKRQVNF